MTNSYSNSNSKESSGGGSLSGPVYASIPYTGGARQGVRRYVVEGEPSRRALVGILRLLRWKRARPLVIRVEVLAPGDGGIYIWTRWYPLRVRPGGGSRS